MLQPKFQTSQEDAKITITLRVPYIRTQDVEIDVEDDGVTFRFHSRPYFLRLHLPGRVSVDEERRTASYDVGSGELAVHIPKETPGETFPDLDFLTRLLVAPSKSDRAGARARKPLIEVMGEERLADEGDVENAHFDWSLPQDPRTDEPLLVPDTAYGFLNTPGLGPQLREVAPELVDCARDGVIELPREEKSRVRREEEDARFDEDHYIADFLGEEELAHILHFKVPWIPVFVSDDTSETWLTFTERESEQLAALPTKEYLLDDVKAVYLGLVDVLFAVLYDYRTTEGENTVESPWTICKVSATLCWNERFDTIQSVLTSSFRRALAYPLYRSWRLLALVQEDLASLLALGKRGALKCLLQARDLFERHEAAHIVGRLWMEDYCVWLQAADDKVLQTLHHEIVSFRLDRAALGWPLEELEQIARTHEM